MLHDVGNLHAPLAYTTHLTRYFHGLFRENLVVQIVILEDESRVARARMSVA